MYKKLTKGDNKRIVNAYYNKVQEYSKLTLEELKELFPKLGGSYKLACIHVTEQKLKDKALNEKIEEVKQDKTETNE